MRLKSRRRHSQRDEAASALAWAAAPAIAWLGALSIAVCVSAGCRPLPAATARSAKQAEPQSPIRFVDLTHRAGIDFVASNGKTPSKYMVETMGSGCAFLDFDNDGSLDILLLNGRPLAGQPPPRAPTLRLYHNDGHGVFTDVTHKAGLDQTMFAMGCAVGDYDNDGYDDIYVTCVLGPSRLYHNNRNGTFTDVAAKAGVTNSRMWGTSCAWTDVDCDGRLDLVVCNYVEYPGLRADLPCFEAGGVRSYCLPGAYPSSHPVVYHNNGDGTFTDITAAAGMKVEGKGLGVAVWDYDNDGLPDIFIANDTTAGFLFHNLGGNRFQEVGIESGIAFDDQGIPHSGMGIDVNDVNNDGKSTVVITNYSGQQTSLYNEARSGLWHDDKRSTGIGPATAPTLGFGAFFGDFDNDGLKDVLIVNGHVMDTIAASHPEIGYAERPVLFRNLGAGKFQNASNEGGVPFTAPIVARGAAWGDYDNDGRLDVLVTTNGGPAYLWHNETQTSNHWMMFKLIGVKSNRDGIGSVVTVKTGRHTYRSAVRSGSSYLSASDLRAHFGLGADAAATVEVRWPSGVTDVIAGVAADRLWTLKEGTGRLE
jgi:enediyne biosynthesis protein E4